MYSLQAPALKLQYFQGDRWARNIIEVSPFNRAFELGNVPTPDLIGFGGQQLSGGSQNSGHT